MDTATAVTELLDQPQATPAADPAAPAAPSSTPAAPVTPAFLEVNDRTKYSTKEDAVKGWNEAQSRITQLSAWEQKAKEYGVTDPADVARLFDELLKFRDERAASQATPAPAAPAPATVQTAFDAAIKGDRAAYAQLPDAWKQSADQWIQHNEMLTKQGYVRADAIKPLQERLDALTQSQQSAEEAKVQATRDNGAQILGSLIEKSGVAFDASDRTRIENAIEDEIVRSSRDARNQLIPNSAEDRFLRGDATERAAILETHFKWFLSFGDKFKQSKDAQYAASKTAAQNQQPRNLPAPGATTPATTSGRTYKSAAERVAAVNAMFEADAQ